MSTDIPSNTPNNPKPPETLDPRLFAQAVNGVSSLIDQLGATPITPKNDQSGATFDVVDLPPGTELGKHAEITGHTQGVAYNLGFNLFYEQTAAAEGNKTVVFIYVVADETEGSTVLTSEERSSEDRSPDKGGIIGIIDLDTDRVGNADFDHPGTNISTNPAAQAVLNKTIDYFGFKDTEVFVPETRSHRVDDNRLEKLIAGLAKLSNDPQI